MKDDLKLREQLSALADGQLQGAEWSEAVAYAQSDDGRAHWEVYHLVGDVLRSSDLGKPSDRSLAARVRSQLEQDRTHVELPEPARVVAKTIEAQDEAANAAVFRWKMVAGLASLAAVGVLGWNGLNALQQSDGGAQLASIAAPGQVQGATIAATEVAGSQQVMLRDPRLDELLAAHKQYGGASALQMPAGFLRNATFETSAR
ncbi:sigma-E factor negative regulatory protein [Paracidovorax anthurii]|uniref:RseA-like anti sigma(E) protein n=1 Tax=Paracidovorax anthurii TaxID=78229 RepID=A0A328Z6W6_9BURK|nr:sigma-E factor negative regulatory protein [Paracidovorax anthurii]RAR81778.1 RseA-like anti sigma(E) protein [Paracidovorax anthurii]